MKRLLILRHAHSGYHPNISDDFYRPLSNRGKSECKEVALKLKSIGFIPEKVIASAATRTTLTAHLVFESLGLAENQISTEKSLYEALPEAYFNCIYGLDNNLKNVAIVGHNPTISSLYSFLSDHGMENIGTGQGFIIYSKTDNWVDFKNSSKSNIEKI